MKTITCRQLGGPCDEPITAKTPDEMMTKGMEHMEEAHPDMAEDIRKMPEDDPQMIDWQKKFEKTWAETPDK